MGQVVLLQRESLRCRGSRGPRPPTLAEQLRKLGGRGFSPACDCLVNRYSSESETEEEGTDDGRKARCDQPIVGEALLESTRRAASRAGFRRGAATRGDNHLLLGFGEPGDPRGCLEETAQFLSRLHYDPLGEFITLFSSFENQRGTGGDLRSLDSNVQFSTQPYGGRSPQSAPECAAQAPSNGRGRRRHAPPPGWHAADQ